MVSHKLHIKANLLHAQIEIIAKVARRLINLAQPERGKRVAIAETLQRIEIVIYLRHRWRCLSGYKLRKLSYKEIYADVEQNDSGI